MKETVIQYIYRRQKKLRDDEIGVGLQKSVF